VPTKIGFLIQIS